MAGVFLLLPCSPSLAHSSRGHNVIEAAAYKSLLEKGRHEIPGFPSSTGKDVLDYLIAAGILRPPRCYPLHGRIDPSCLHYAGKDSLRWLPVTGSGDMDAVMYRQFSENGQIFHFMAVPSDIYDDPEMDERTGAPHGLSSISYPRALRFVTGLLYDILRNEEEARRYYRDIYALMHTVADSYSQAHVERDTSTWRIKYLKPWQATAWQPYLVHWSGWKHLFTDNHHRFPVDGRDDEYYREDLVSPDETDYFDMNPYLVPRRYLNTGGLKAAEAIEDLLVTVFSILQGSQTRERIDARIPASQWRTFMHKHFPSMTDSVTIDTLTIESPRAEEEEWRPLTLAGIRGRTGSIPGTLDRTIAVNFGKPPSPLDPFAFTGGLEFGRRRGPDESTWIASISFSLYLWLYSDMLAWGFDPSIVEVSFEGRDVAVDPLLSFLRLDAYFSRRVWLSVEGPRYSFKQGFRSREFALTLGVAFSKESLFHFARPVQTNPQHGSAAGDAWTTPDVDSPLRLRSKDFGIFYPFGYSLFLGKRQVAIHPLGYAYVWDLNRQSKSTALGAGVYAGLGLEFLEGRVWSFMKVNPLARMRISRILTFQAEPVSLTNRLGMSRGAGNSTEFHGAIGIALVLGSMEVGVDLLRYSYDQRRLDQKAIAGIRFGIQRE